MINHFRTLVLNKAFSTAEDHVAKDFSPLVLPAQLNRFKDIVMPPHEPEFQALYRMYNYERIIQSAGLEDFTRQFDSRVTYSLDDLIGYFNYNQISKSALVVGETLDQEITITAQIKAPLSENELMLRIVQIDGSNSVCVYREDPGYGVLETLITPVALTWSGAATNAGVSQILHIPTYGVTLIFSSPIDFTASSNKAWRITINTKRELDLPSLIGKLKQAHATIVNQMLGYKSKYSTYTFDTYWSQHHNSVYQFAGLLLGYFYRVQTFIES